MKQLTLIVPDDASGRVDKFTADASGLTRSYVQKLIAEGLLRVGGVALKGSETVVPGMVVELEVPDPKPLDLTPEPMALSIVYEDADMLIVDKPFGLVVHPSAGHDGGTLVNALLARGSDYGGIAGVQRPGIVPRLDRDTSGLLMVAKNDLAQASLMAQLKERSITKTYLGLVHGAVAATNGRIEAPIGRDPQHRTRMAVVPDGRPSTTGYRVRERWREWTLLELDLVTGRTHQIRVHLAAIDHPLAGDPLYGTGTSRRGPEGLERLFLHAWKIELRSPSDDHVIRAEAPLPEELEGVLEGLRAVEGARGGTRPGLGGGREYTAAGTAHGHGRRTRRSGQ
jgi:23S rRNA pseudouridine1911/1915/1917 synthase